ncbi:MAG: hypothetical protein AAF216_09710 [Pseudomonadota bacterium]
MNTHTLTCVIGAAALLVASCGEPATTPDATDDDTPTLSDAQLLLPETLTAADLYDLLEAQAGELKMENWNGESVAYQAPQRPNSDAEIEAAQSGAFARAEGACTPAGMTALPRWDCVLRVNGFDKYAPGEIPEDEGGEWAEIHRFAIRYGAPGEPELVIDPELVDVMFAG